MQNFVAGSVTITGATGAITNNTGLVSSCTRNGAGDYTFVLGKPISLTEIHPAVTQLHAAVRGGHAVELVDSTHLRVRCVDAANPNAAADPTSLVVTFLKTRW